MGSLVGVLNQRVAEFSFSTPSAPPSTYAFELTRGWGDLIVPARGDCQEYTARKRKEYVATSESNRSPVSAESLIHGPRSRRRQVFPATRTCDQSSNGLAALS